MLLLIQKDQFLLNSLLLKIIIIVELIFIILTQFNLLGLLVVELPNKFVAVLEDVPPEKANRIPFSKKIILKINYKINKYLQLPPNEKPVLNDIYFLFLFTH